MADGSLVTTKKKSKSQRALDKLLPTVRLNIDDAIQFMVSEFGDDFEKADRYYNGKVDVPQTRNRSEVVATPVRDSVRAMRPSIMRVLASNRTAIVKYKPVNIKQAAIMDAQTKYAHQTFWESGGYMALYSIADESLRHKFCAVKTYWQENPTPVYRAYSMLTQEDINTIRQQPDVMITRVEPASPPMGMQVPAPLFDVELLTAKSNGRICIDPIHWTEFFISQNAHGTADAAVHGHQRVCTVGEAQEMGIDFDDWDSLPEYTEDEIMASGNDQERRGYPLKAETTTNLGLGKKILLTEAYIRADLHDVGFLQTYCLYFSGVEYRLLDYYQETESPIDVARHDPIPFTPSGYSVADTVADTQDVMTSMLRGMVDNVHLANTPRFGANPQQVNMDDLMNHTVGHPIRFKAAGATVQVITTPSQLQATMPMLQWLEQDSQNKIGVTKAAQGLDPNAMQSTDKDAVQNTIMLSQGQVELAVRNLVETAVVPIFRKVLRLSMEHKDDLQAIRIGNGVVPFDQTNLDPNMYAEPAVGLGTATAEMQMAGLQGVLQNQISIVTQLGLANPVVGLANIYNTLEDMTVGFGLDNVGRYFNYVDKNAEQAFAEQQRQQKIEDEKAGKPIDPGLALVQAEQIKSQTKNMTDVIDARTKALQVKLESLKALSDDDFRRDEMEQELYIEAAKLLAQFGVTLDTNAVKREQALPRPAANDIDVVATSADQGLPPVPQPPQATAPAQPLPASGPPPGAPPTAPGGQPFPTSGGAQ